MHENTWNLPDNLTKNEMKFNEAINLQEAIIKALHGTPVGYRNKIITCAGNLLTILNYQTNRICRLQGRLERAVAANSTTAQEKKETTKKE